MTVLLFIHGTSVRESGHDTTLGSIRRQVAALNRSWTVETCYWGTVFGASLSGAGASVPSYQHTRERPKPKSDDIALWSVLYTDPLYELRVLALKPSGPAPFGPPPGAALLQEMAGLEPSTDTRELFASMELADGLPDAIAAVATSDALASAAQTVAADPIEHRQAIARAIIAATLARADMAGTPSVSGWMRDRLVARVAADLKADVLGVSDWLKKTAWNLATHLWTPPLLAHRGTVTDAATPAAGDILRFLARPQPVEDYLTAHINGITDPDVYLLGHSLGGIICLDLLARTVPTNVRGLITVGSQAPYLYEIGALPSLAPGSELPANMPPWLNIYDPRDILSYIGADIFGDRVRDVEIDSNQPFPQAHSAYWDTPTVWDAITEFVKASP